MPLAGVATDAQPDAPRTSAAASRAAARRHFGWAPSCSHTFLSRFATEKT